LRQLFFSNQRKVFRNGPSVDFDFSMTCPVAIAFTLF